MRVRDQAGQQSIPRKAAWRRGAIGLASAVALLFLLDAAIFRTGLYFIIAEVDSAAGSFEREVRVERARPRDARRQFLIVGDSRSQAIRPRIAEQLRPQRDIAFANAAVFGSTPRSWYYLLRELDPHANRYSVVFFGMDDFDDNGDLAPSESPADVRRPISGLGLGDLFDFPFSFQDPVDRRDAFLECLLHGYAYGQDFQDFLSHPWARLRKSVQSRHQYVEFLWKYVGAEGSLAGLEVDWGRRALRIPDSTSAQTREALQKRVEHPIPPENPQQAGFRREWLTRIAKHYRSSRTLLVFLRMPCSPLPIPASLRVVPRRTVLLDLAAQPNVLLLDEHLFDCLERPEYFRDYTHLNADGAVAITRILVDHLPLILAKAEGKHLALLQFIRPG